MKSDDTNIPWKEPERVLSCNSISNLAKWDFLIYRSLIQIDQISIYLSQNKHVAFAGIDGRLVFSRNYHTGYIWYK